MKKKKVTGKKRGRPRGSPRQGSGKHPLDAAWRKRGYLTLAEAAVRLSMSKSALYLRVHNGQLVQGVDYEKASPGHGGAVYVRGEAVDRLMAARMPPEARS